MVKTTFINFNFNDLFQFFLFTFFTFLFTYFTFLINFITLFISYFVYVENICME